MEVVKSKWWQNGDVLHYSQTVCTLCSLGHCISAALDTVSHCTVVANLCIPYHPPSTSVHRTRWYKWEPCPGQECFAIYCPYDDATPEEVTLELYWLMLILKYNYYHVSCILYDYRCQNTYSCTCHAGLHYFLAQQRVGIMITLATTLLLRLSTSIILDIYFKHREAVLHTEGRYQCML